VDIAKNRGPKQRLKKPQFLNVAAWRGVHTRPAPGLVRSQQNPLTFTHGWGHSMSSSYLAENRHIAVKRCRHGLFMYNRNDSFVGRGLDLYGEWCEFEIRLLHHFIKPGDTVVDAGANIGTHTIAFANFVGPTGIVHAYEPQRRTFTMLAGNVALNAIDWVDCHQQAVGETAGEIRVPPLPPPDTAFNFAAMPLATASPGDEKVRLVTLDALDLRSCAVIKIDVEGMEAAVIAGAKRLIERYRPLLYVENNDREGSKRMARRLAEIGYAGYWSIHPYYDPTNFCGNPVNIWQEFMPSVNLFCVPKEMKFDPGDFEPFLGEDDDWGACIQRVRSRLGI
jgi:FkbM family methyltransferase